MILDTCSIMLIYLLKYLTIRRRLDGRTIRGI